MDITIKTNDKNHIFVVVILKRFEKNYKYNYNFTYICNKFKVYLQ